MRYGDMSYTPTMQAIPHGEPKLAHAMSAVALEPDAFFGEAQDCNRLGLFDICPRVVTTHQAAPV
jgi:hypothetical protein